MSGRGGARAVVLGGLVGGALDLCFALSFAAANGVVPARVLRTIASGLLGQAAYTGPAGIAALGLACHFGLSLLWAALYLAAGVRWPALHRRAWLAGPLFGLLVFFAMRLVVLPLSAYPRPVAFPPLASTLDLLSHMFLFGLPIAWFAARARRA